MLLSDAAELVIRDLIARSSDRLVSFPIDIAVLKTELLDALPSEWQSYVADPESVSRRDGLAFEQFLEQGVELGMLSGGSDITSIYGTERQMNENEIPKSGDLVVLKSGGPKMTAQHVIGGAGQSPACLLCRWFDDSNQLREGTFALPSLKKDDA